MSCDRVWMRGPLLILLVAVAAAACSSSKPGPDDDARRWAAQMPTLRPEQVGDRPYDILTALEERRQIGAMGEDDAAREAERLLKLRAAKVDADALVLVYCGRITDPNDWEASRVPTLLCQGYAIRWLDP